DKVKYEAKFDGKTFLGYKNEKGELYPNISKSAKKLEEAYRSNGKITVVSRFNNWNCTVTEYTNNIDAYSVQAITVEQKPVVARDHFSQNGVKGKTLKIDSCVKYEDLKEQGKKVYDKNKGWIPEVDQDILLQIAKIADDLPIDVYNSFVGKQDHDGDLFWHTDGNGKSTEYSREKLQNTLLYFTKYKGGYDKLLNHNFTTCDELLQLVKDNFQITVGSYSPITDTKTVSFIETPFAHLNITRKKHLVDILYKCDYSTLQNVADDVDAGKILATIFKFTNKNSTGKNADAKELIDYIVQKNYLKHFVEDLDGGAYETFMNSLFNIITKNYDYKNTYIIKSGQKANYLKFDPSYLQLNSENFEENGEITLGVKRWWFKDDYYTITGKPYDGVVVEFDKDVTFGTNIMFKKGQKVQMPMIWAYQLFWEDTKAARWKTAQITLEVGLTALGVGEGVWAVRAYRTAQTARATFLAIKAVADMGVGFTDIYINNTNTLTDEQLQKWNKFVLLYSVGSFTTSAVDGLVQKFGSKAISNSDEFADFERTLANENLDLDDAMRNLPENQRTEIESVLGTHADEVGGVIDLIKAEQRYAKTYVSASSKPYGLQISLDEVETVFGENGRKIVEETQKKAKELISQTGGNIQGDPVLTGLIDNKTGQIFFGRNLKTQSQIDDFLENLHQILKKRLEVHQTHVTNKTLKATDIDIQRAGIPASHSEIVAIDEALKIRGVNVTEADLSDFIIHNKRLGGEVDSFGVPKGCPPRCTHCWFLSNDIKVIGND
ncbi:MAG: hypothetical protein RL662_1121, partial [Bacteroidota bacterium]